MKPKSASLKNRLPRSVTPSIGVLHLRTGPKTVASCPANRWCEQRRRSLSEQAGQLAQQENISYTIGIGADRVVQRFFGARAINPSAELDEAMPKS